ncbi:MAG TPA: CRTAC1 family protein [Phycisphaerales bacterium]|nr:CRTAC1 family protein [Phycisphaerales bacterium]HMP38349.1 CRTAC1 family protein [Phycisphaerales bacterium]
MDCRRALLLIVAGSMCGSGLRASNAPAAPGDGPRFIDATEALGLGPEVVDSIVARCVFADLDGDGAPDIVLDRHRVFLNRPDASSSFGRRFVEVSPDRCGLEAPLPGTTVVFVDLDDDGHLDALVAEHCDIGNPEWTDHGRRTRWLRGRGDGTFGPAELIETPPRPTIAVAVGDIDLDGRLDLWFGNTYVRQGHSLIAFPNDLLLSGGGGRNAGSERGAEGERAGPGWIRVALPEDDLGIELLDDERDAGGRPTFGAMIWNVDGGAPWLIELGYGRRWNRVWARSAGGGWVDVAPALGLDGDAIRHGRHPEWLAERARTDPRLARSDEKPFRSNGNSFDLAIGDVDGDGQLDLLVTEITHAWAGESSDRTRLLFGASATGGWSGPIEGVVLPPPFVERAGWSLDRVPMPGDQDERRWNQGDLFGALADLDHDGRLEVIVSSGDYPDDERLRIFVRAAADPEHAAGAAAAPSEGARLVDATRRLGIDHDGSQQISFADVDGDGALDILVGQTFNRFTADQIEGRSPRPKIYLNRSAEGRRSIILRLDGRPGANRHGLGATVRVRLPDGGERVATLQGPGGHAGKQHDAILHFGLGGHDRVEAVTIDWPGVAEPLRFGPLAAGAWVLRLDGAAKRTDLSRRTPDSAVEPPARP